MFSKLFEMRKCKLFSFFLFIHSLGFAQLENIEFAGIDTVFSKLIKSVNVNDGQNTQALALFPNNGDKQLYLEFDLMEGSPRTLYYTLRYFDRSWKPSEVDLLEVLDGVNEVNINSAQTSIGTYVQYVHYTIPLLPNSLLLKQSGNFLLIVYDQTGEVYLSKKLFIYNPVFTIKADFFHPTDPLKLSTHQAINMVLNTGKINVFNPKEEIQLEVLQNGNEQTKQVFHEPLFFSGNSLRYTKTDGIIFAAGKEFRGGDLRSMQRKAYGVQYWDQIDGTFHCFLKKDETRVDKNYIFNYDYNGKMVYISRDVVAQTSNTRSEYVYVHFNLDTKQELDHDVYIYGLISDWKLKDEFKLKWDEASRSYKNVIYVKNAYIDYAYATLSDDKKVSTSEVEGDWSETENDYFILCYYRPFGSRFDQLLLAATINSNRN